jgi:hypothetical protein
MNLAKNNYAVIIGSRGAPEKSGIKGKAVKIGCGPATVIGESHSLRLVSQPLSRAAGWEGRGCGDDPKARKPAREITQINSSTERVLGKSRWHSHSASGDRKPFLLLP